MILFLELDDDTYEVSGQKSRNKNDRDQNNTNNLNYISIDHSSRDTQMVQNNRLSQSFYQNNDDFSVKIQDYDNSSNFNENSIPSVKKL